MKTILGTFLLTLLLIASVQRYFDSSIDQVGEEKFLNWMTQNSKQYSVAEYQFRFKVFQDNLKMISQHNANKDSTYLMGLNQFGDLTNQEFIAKYLSQNIHNTIVQNAVQYVPTAEELKNLPNAIDWRGVTVMKDQGACTSGWAFSVIAPFEAYYQVYKGQKLQFSEQNVVDCDKTSRGCTDGNNVNGFRFMKDYGIQTSDKYPYTGVTGTCKSTVGAYKISNYGFVGSEYSLKQALISHPASAGVDAQKWQFYSSGVYGDCGITWNHYVTVVGYEDSGNWILKNSWGSGWGEAGHIRLKSGNTCGVLSQAYQNK